MNALSKKLGPLPVWAWGALVAGGGLWFMSGSSAAPSDGSNQAGGQTVPNYQYKPLLQGQSLGGGTIPENIDELVTGPSMSWIDGSFFGDGPLSLWTAGPMDYSNSFGNGRRGRRGKRGHDYGSVGADFPAGAGGYGYHEWRGPDFPPAPVGGQGYENAGQNYIGGFGGGPAHGGGNPWNQQTTMGAAANTYMTQRGDTLQSIAAKFWGKGSDYSPLQQANDSTIGSHSRNGKLSAGIVLTIPGAPHSGPAAPGGPAGNGIGGGSVGGSGLNHGIGTAPPGMTSDRMGQPGAGTSHGGASGGGSPTEGSSNGNSSRVKQGNQSRSYAVSGQHGGSGTGSKRSNKR